MGFSLVPSRVVNSIFQLTPEQLSAHGIRLVLADLDNTLASYETPQPPGDLRAWKDALSAAGITLFVVSNSRKGHRCPDFCAALGVPYLCHAGKPSTRGFRMALAQTGCTPSQAVMVGDQIFTDTLGANRSGVASVLVHPIAWGKNPLRAVRYAIESPFRWLGAKKGM